MGDAGSGSQELGVGGGHGGGQDTGDYDAGDDGGKRSHLGQGAGGVDYHILSLGLGAGHCYCAGLCHAVAHNADDNGDAQGDHHPDGAHTAGELQLGPVADGHEVEQDVGHTEVSKAPGQSGGYHEGGVAAGLGGLDIGGGCEAQVAGDLFRIGNNGVHSACGVDAEYQHYNEGKGHHDALDKAGDGGGHKSSGGAVGHDDGGGDYHGAHVVKTEEAVKELAAGGKSGSGVRHEEDDDYQSAQGLDKLGVVPESDGDEVRDGDGMYLFRVETQPLCHDEPVKVGAQGQAYGRPAGFRQAAEQCQAGDAHEQIGAHVGGFGAHGGDYWAQLASAQIKVLGIVVL